MAATIYEPLSTAHLKSCTVDFDSRPDKKAVNLVQYDQTIPVLCVSLKKGGTEYKVPSDADVNIRMDKRDGYHVYNPALGVNAERTIAYFAVTPQMSTGWGDYYPIVEITVGGGIAGSAPIWLHFDRNPLPENAIISSDEYKTIQQLLEDVTAVKAATEQIKAQTEAVRDQAKGFADNAKNSADKAQTLVDGMPADYSQAMKDIGTLKNQMQRAYPDNSSIGDKPWSSKHIIDMLCQPLEESGNPVVCYPVAGYPLGVKASWEPMQEGTGTPSPENIRPIKGRDSVTVERCGANLSKISDISTPNKSLIPVELPTEIVADIEISFDTLNAEIKNVGTAFFLNKADGKWKAITVQDFGISTAGKIPNGRKTAVFHGVTFKTVETVIVENGYCKWSGDVNNFCVSIIQNAPYKPYIGQTNTLTLPETVYGGEVDAVSGDAKETWKTLTLDGTEMWTRQDRATSSYSCRIKPTANNLTNCLCNMLPWKLYAYSIKGNEGYFAFESGGDVVHFCTTETWETVDAWKAYLAAQNAAGTPVQIAYKLAEPVPFTATGAQPIHALAGANTVLTDADSATVTGRADPIKKITDLEAAVASIN